MVDSVVSVAILTEVEQESRHILKYIHTLVYRKSNYVCVQDEFWLLTNKTDSPKWIFCLD